MARYQKEILGLGRWSSSGSASGVIVQTEEGFLRWNCGEIGTQSMTEIGWYTPAWRLMTWIRPADLPPMICREWSPLVCSCFLSLQIFCILFVGIPIKMLVVNWSWTARKVEVIEILHEYFRPRGCIKYCRWEDKTQDHLARGKELMELDESRETSRTQCGWQPWWNQPLYRLWDLNALCINYCAADTAATNCKLWFFFVNKQNSKTRYYFQRCSLLLNDAENSPETAYWPQMVYKPHHTTQYKVQLHFSNNKTLKKFQCDMRKSEIDDWKDIKEAC